MGRLPGWGLVGPETQQQRNIAMETAPATGTTELTTRSGMTLTVRPATPADEAMLEQMFDAVSPDDRRFRFLSACDHVGHDRLEPLTNVDHWQTENFLAFDGGELVATAMLACDKAMDTAEVAISIVEDHKGKGIGWSLLEYLGAEARRRGVKKLQSIESRDNHSAIELEREMGFTARPFEDDPTLVVLEAKF